jgi:hypothetical protein
MIPKKPARDLIRGGYRFSEQIMRHEDETAPGLEEGGNPGPLSSVGSDAPDPRTMANRLFCLLKAISEKALISIKKLEKIA